MIALNYDTKTCPECGKVYILPSVKTKEDFITLTRVQREQYLSGICSDKCWFLYYQGLEIDPAELDEEGNWL